MTYFSLCILKEFPFLTTRYKLESCVLGQIHIKAIDSVSGECLCFFVFGWGGYQVLDFNCATME